MIFLDTITKVNIIKVDTYKINNLKSIYKEKEVFDINDIILLGFFIKKYKLKENQDKDDFKLQLNHFIKIIEKYNFICQFIGVGDHTVTVGDRKRVIKEGLVVTRAQKHTSILGCANQFSTIIIPKSEIKRIAYQLYVEEFFTLENITFGCTKERIYVSNNYQIGIPYHYKNYNNWDKDLFKYWESMGFNISVKPEIDYTEKYRKDLLSLARKHLKIKVGL